MTKWSDGGTSCDRCDAAPAKWSGLCEECHKDPRTLAERLWVVADLAKQLLENDGAGHNYDAHKAHEARVQLAVELDGLKKFKRAK
jgi:predicted ATP-dependent serine protease